MGIKRKKANRLWSYLLGPNIYLSLKNIPLPATSCWIVTLQNIHLFHAILFRIWDLIVAFHLCLRHKRDNTPDVKNMEYKYVCVSNLPPIVHIVLTHVFLGFTTRLCSRYQFYLRLKVHEDNSTKKISLLGERASWFKYYIELSYLLNIRHCDPH